MGSYNGSAWIGLYDGVLKTAGDGHWKTMIFIRKDREISGTGIMNQTTVVGSNYVFTWIIMANGMICHVTTCCHFFAMVVRTIH